MKNYVIAWRNLWRNKRRTLITVASVFFAVFFAVIMRAWQLGTYDHMFRNVIESYTGYIQIQQKDFQDNRIVDNAFEYDSTLESRIISTPNVVSAIPRFESFALASSGLLTKGVLVLGVDPEKETGLSDIRSRLVRFRIDGSNFNELMQSGLPGKVKKRIDLVRENAYATTAALCLELGIEDSDTAELMPLFRKYASVSNGYFSTGEKGVLVGYKLSRFLEARVGDTLVLLGQGYHGTTAAGKYRINGIVKLPTPDIDNKIVYLPYDVCQELYNAQGMLTSLAVSLKDNRDPAIDRTIVSLVKEVKDPLKVLGWREMNKLLINQMDADSKSGTVMIFILYLVIAFGIFGTVLMMTAERKREFGVLVAIGMQKSKLASVVVIEMLYVGFLGIVSGVALALPAIFYGHYNPIRFSGSIGKMYEDYGMEAVMPFMLPDTYILWQSVVVAIIILIALIYPVRKIMRMKVVNSLKA